MCQFLCDLLKFATVTPQWYKYTEYYCNSCCIPVTRKEVGVCGFFGLKECHPFPLTEVPAVLIPKDLESVCIFN